MTTLKRYNGTAWEHIGLPSNVGMSPQTLGYAQVTASQGSIGSGGAVDLTGLTVTVTVPEGRRLRLSGYVPATNTLNDCGHLIRIVEGGTILSAASSREPLATEETHYNPTVVITPTAGTHTYKLTAQTYGGGTGTVSATTGNPAFILVEDITGSTLPYQPASVPVGQLAYTQDTNIQGSITTETILTNYSVNVAVPAGRQLRISLMLHHFSSVANDAFRLQIKEDGTSVSTFEDTYRLAGTQQVLKVSTVRSPASGSHAYTVTLLRVSGTGTLSTYNSTGRIGYLLVEDITPTPAPSTGAPGSTLGYAETSTEQTGISTGVVALTGLSVLVTVPAGRRLRITGQANFDNNLAGANWVLFGIERNGVGINNTVQSLAASAAAGEYGAGSVVAVDSPSAGTHTYRLTAAANAASVQTISTAARPAFILVEDVTGSVWPEGSAVTAGMVASEAWTDYTPTDLNVTVGNGTRITRYQRIGRTIHFTWSLVLGSTSSFGSGVSVGLPVAAAATGAWACSVYMLDSGTQDYMCGARITTGGSTARITLGITTGTAITGGGGVTSTIPFTWATGDRLEVSGTYEAAS